MDFTPEDMEAVQSCLEGIDRNVPVAVERAAAKLLMPNTDAPSPTSSTSQRGRPEQLRLVVERWQPAADVRINWILMTAAWGWLGWREANRHPSLAGHPVTAENPLGVGLSTGCRGSFRLCPDALAPRTSSELAIPFDHGLRGRQQRRSDAGENLHSLRLRPMPDARSAMLWCAIDAFVSRVKTNSSKFR